MIAEKTRFQNVIKIDLIENNDRQLISKHPIEEDEEVQIVAEVKSQFFEH